VNKRMALTAAGLAGALVMGGGVALATTTGPVSGGVITGCYTNAEVNGSHALVLPDADTNCPNGGGSITVGAGFVQVGTVTPPAGTYLLTGTITFVVLDSSGTRHVFGCEAIRRSQGLSLSHAAHSVSEGASMTPRSEEFKSPSDTTFAQLDGL